MSRLPAFPTIPKGGCLPRYDVRNLVINCCWNTGEDLTMRYLYSKEDLTNAQLDHDYLQRPLTENWVDNICKVIKKTD